MEVGETAVQAHRNAGSDLSPDLSLRRLSSKARARLMGFNRELKAEDGMARSSERGSRVDQGCHEEGATTYGERHLLANTQPSPPAHLPLGRLL
jgi:hypothetical protein